MKSFYFGVDVGKAFARKASVKKISSSYLLVGFWLFKKQMVSMNRLASGKMSPRYRICTYKLVCKIYVLYFVLR